MASGSPRAEFKLRLRERLRRKLERAAKRNARSMNAEILARINRKPDKLTRARLAKIINAALNHAIATTIEAANGVRR